MRLAFATLLMTTLATGEYHNVKAGEFCANLKSVVSDARSGFPNRGEFSPPLEDFPNPPGEKDYECGKETIGDTKGRCQIVIGERDEDGTSDVLMVTWKKNDYSSARADGLTLANAVGNCFSRVPDPDEIDREEYGSVRWLWREQGVEIIVRAARHRGKYGTGNSVRLVVTHYR